MRDRLGVLTSVALRQRTQVFSVVSLHVQVSVHQLLAQLECLQQSTQTGKGQWRQVELNLLTIVKSIKAFFSKASKTYVTQTLN
jgi:hypothetical protein